jgi:hypothetical protein
MTLSSCMAITSTGILVYLGHKGQLYEILGGKDGQLNMIEL